nr:hypothetical protein [Armatimonas sp.]
MKRQNNSLLSLLWLVCGADAMAQDNGNVNPIVVLPDNTDFVGKFVVKEIYQATGGSVSLVGERASGNPAKIDIDIAVLYHKKEAERIYSDYLPSSPDFFERSFSGKKFGEKIFTTKVDDANHTFRRIVVLDGLSVVMITMTGQPVMSGGQPVRMLDNTIRKHALYQDDTSLMDKLMIHMLERLTVLGVTSKPSSSASSAARQYVTIKKQNPPKSRKVEISG